MGAEGRWIRRDEKRGLRNEVSYALSGVALVVTVLTAALVRKRVGTANGGSEACRMKRHGHAQVTP